MSREITKDIYRYNLCSVYLLPLLELGIFNFGEDNFVNCYVNPDGTLLFVQVNNFAETEDPYHNRHYACTTVDNHRKLIVYRIPEKWRHTFQMYCEGRYSEFTKAAKAMIIQHSGLNWKLPTSKPTIVLSDARLLAMYRGDALRDLLAEQFDTDPLLMEGELISPPKASEFLDLIPM